jgi:hypothetical protein
MSTPTTSSTQPNQEQNQEQTKIEHQQQQPFDLEIKSKITTELQALYNQQQQQNSSTNAKTRYIRFADGERKRLSFMDFEKKPVQNKDFATGKLIPDSYTDRYFFSCYDITDPYHPSELSVFERGPREAKTILTLLSKNHKVLDIERHGASGDKFTSYTIYPAVD